VYLSGWGFKADACHQALLEFRNVLNLSWADIRPITVNKTTEYLSEKIQADSIIVAWSLGGIFALNLAKKYPLKCQKLILISTTPKFLANGDWPGISLTEARLFRENLAGDLKYFLSQFISLVQFPHRSLRVRKALVESLDLDESNADRMAQYLGLLFQADLKEYYQALKVKTLHILGDKDPLVKIEAFKQVFNPHIATHIIEGAGHVPFLTHREKFLTTLRRFIHE